MSLTIAIWSERFFTINKDNELNQDALEGLYSHDLNALWYLITQSLLGFWLPYYVSN